MNIEHANDNLLVYSAEHRSSERRPVSFVLFSVLRWWSLHYAACAPSCWQKPTYKCLKICWDFINCCAYGAYTFCDPSTYRKFYEGWETSLNSYNWGIGNTYYSNVRTSVIVTRGRMLVWSLLTVTRCRPVLVLILTANKQIMALGCYRCWTSLRLPVLLVLLLIWPF